jgi:hypothetical protein
VYPVFENKTSSVFIASFTAFLLALRIWGRSSLMTGILGGIVVSVLHVFLYRRAVQDVLGVSAGRGRFLRGAYVARYPLLGAAVYYMLAHAVVHPLGFCLGIVSGWAAGLAFLTHSLLCGTGRERTVCR